MIFDDCFDDGVVVVVVVVDVDVDDYYYCYQYHFGKSIEVLSY